MALNDFDGARRVLDVSGDGENNSGISATAGRDYALANGVDRINGIAIEMTGLETYYANNVIGGTGSFTLFASGFDTFDAGIRKKLNFEITGGGPAPVPLPAGAWLVLSGLGALGVARRRKDRRT